MKNKIRNANEIFQIEIGRVIEDFGKVKNIQDDIIVWSSDLEEHGH